MLHIKSKCYAEYHAKTFYAQHWIGKCRWNLETFFALNFAIMNQWRERMWVTVSSSAFQIVVFCFTLLSLHVFDAIFLPLDVMGGWTNESPLGGCNHCKNADEILKIPLIKLSRVNCNWRWFIRIPIMILPSCFSWFSFTSPTIFLHIMNLSNQILLLKQTSTSFAISTRDRHSIT